MGNEHQSKEVAIDIEPATKYGHCIYRVPDQLRKINKEAYTPRLVSIGPLHHGSTKLNRLETQKKKYLDEYIHQRIGIDEKLLEDFIEKKEKDIRSCYAEPSDELDSQEFVKMTKLDAAFIIELFLKKHLEEDDSILKKPLQEKGIQQDLILLENQLPYFLLQELYNFVLDRHKKYPSFLELTCNFFSSYNTRKATLSDEEDIKHFTDLVRLFLSIDRTIPPKTSEKSTKFLCSATKLDETGVKLEALQDKCLLDIASEKSKCCCFFDKRELKIPCFEVQGDTECIFRNVMALEQCSYPFDTYICSYIRLMGNLINNAKDVSLLVQKGIVVNGLRSNTVMGNMIKKLSQEITERNFYFSDIYEQVNGEYEGCWNQTRAWFYHAITILKSVYFSNLWRGTGTLAAIILLVLTFIQTYCSVLQVL